MFPEWHHAVPESAYFKVPETLKTFRMYSISRYAPGATRLMPRAWRRHESRCPMILAPPFGLCDISADVATRDFFAKTHVLEWQWSEMATFISHLYHQHYITTFSCLWRVAVEMAQKDRIDQQGLDVSKSLEVLCKKNEKCSSELQRFLAKQVCHKVCHKWKFLLCKFEVIYLCRTHFGLT